MDQTASQLRQELDQKRHDLTRDVERIEEKVKSSFDLNRKIDENPLAAVGLSIAGGFLLGAIVGGGKKEHASGAGSTSYPSGGAPSAAFQSGASTPGPHWSGAQWSPPVQQSSQGNGPGIVGAVKAGLNQSVSRGSDSTVTYITAALTAVVMDKAKELLDRTLPGFADRYEQVAHNGAAPMSGAGAVERGAASHSTSGDQTPRPSGEPAFAPANATPMGGSSATGAAQEGGARDPR